MARNDCRMSKDDVALALNHVDEGNRTTDIYIAKDWRIVDDVQRKVTALDTNLLIGSIWPICLRRVDWRASDRILMC